EDVGRVVTRSLKRVLYAPSVGQLAAAWDGEGEPLDLDALVDGLDEWAAPAEWVGLPMELLAGAQFAGEDAEEVEGNAEDLPGDESPADELGVWVHGWGRRVSGFAFSPGGDLAPVWYDKLLEERLSGKRWMEPIHQAGGWRAGMPLTRVEVRFRRAALRD